MSNLEILARKSAQLDRAIARITSTYFQNKQALESDYDVQDIIVLNLIRSCEISIDIGQVMVRAKSLMRPATNSELFARLAEESVISPSSAIALKGMIGFRNVLVHQYDSIDFELVKFVIENQLIILTEFAGQCYAAAQKAN